MTEGRQGADDGAADQGGVFGNLPGSRPGSRSPRRRADDAAPASRKPAKARPRARAATSKAQPAPPRERPSRPQPPPKREPAPAATGHESDRAESGGIEDIAWAGVAVAAEAATIGVRLASRAIEALRGSSERGAPGRE